MRRSALTEGAEMSLLQRQNLGILVVLALSLIVYELSYWDAKHPAKANVLRYGIQTLNSIAVELQGIKEPGIYFLDPGMTFQNVIDIAGARPSAHKNGFDSTELHSGDCFGFFGKGTFVKREMSTAVRLALGLPVDINRLSLDDLTLVPGIGESLAVQIIRLRVEHNGFSSLDELKEIRGIKDRKLNKLKGYLYAGAIH